MTEPHPVFLLPSVGNIFFLLFISYKLIFLAQTICLTSSPKLRTSYGVCVCVSVFVCVSVSLCMCVHVCLCVHGCVGKVSHKGLCLPALPSTLSLKLTPTLCIITPKLSLSCVAIPRLKKRKRESLVHFDMSWFSLLIFIAPPQRFSGSALMLNRWHTHFQAPSCLPLLFFIAADNGKKGGKKTPRRSWSRIYLESI